MTKHTLQKLVIATANMGKKREILNFFAPFGVEILFGDNFNPDAPEETGRTFCENALIKAHAYKHEDYPVLADDSGLVVPALDHRPGIHSHRFAEEAGGYAFAFKSLEDQLKHKSKDAYFECCLVLLWPENTPEFFQGRVEGALVFPARGTEGHGYDSIFQPKGLNQTFAELKIEEKQALSHRGRALQQIIDKYFLHKGIM